jgi:purine operon repressor
VEPLEKIRRGERLAALTRLLTVHPNRLYSLNYFGDLLGAAKSTISEDVTTLKYVLNFLKLGDIISLAGASGGVKFVPVLEKEAIASFLSGLAEELSDPERILPGGYLYSNDIIFDPSLGRVIGEIFAQQFYDNCPDYIVTVETRGIPLALLTAQALGIPLVTIRADSNLTEGSSVSINYFSGSTHRVRRMYLARRALPTGARIVFIDDFMKAGGTAKGMLDLMTEFDAEVLGVGVLVATREPQKKLVQNYFSLLELSEIDEGERKISIIPAYGK